MNFRILGLPADDFTHFFRGVRPRPCDCRRLRRTADGNCPCRVSFTGSDFLKNSGQGLKPTTALLIFSCRDQRFRTPPRGSGRDGRLGFQSVPGVGICEGMVSASF
jgi:hypothetical protein